jgi:hypothetical protein
LHVILLGADISLYYPPQKKHAPDSYLRPLDFLVCLRRVVCFFVRVCFPPLCFDFAIASAVRRDRLLLP